jgi:hypothetical protein
MQPSDLYVVVILVFLSLGYLNPRYADPPAEYNIHEINYLPASNVLGYSVNYEDHLDTTRRLIAADATLASVTGRALSIKDAFKCLRQPLFSSSAIHMADGPDFMTHAESPLL